MRLTAIGNRRDFVGGTILAAIGLLVAIYTLSNYDLGSLSRMGPGMVPALLGGLLTILGLAIVISSLRGGDGPIEIDVRALLAISLGAVVFVLVLETFGLFPAVIVMSLATTMFEDRLSWPGRVVLALVLAAIAVALFPMALGMHISIARWPF